MAIELSPIYIVSKGRAQFGPLTARVLDSLSIPYSIIVEPSDVGAYSQAGHAHRLKVLPQRYKDRYDTLDYKFDGIKGTGPGPARNFAWDLAIESGADWHWVMDDNIAKFRRFRKNMAPPHNRWIAIPMGRELDCAIQQCDDRGAGVLFFRSLQRKVQVLPREPSHLLMCADSQCLPPSLAGKV